jgi:hypothetical protein
VYFATIKFAGYSLAGRFLTFRYREASPNAFVVGGARTAIGIVAGLGAAAVATAVNVEVPSVAWYLLLTPVRLMEWLLVIWFFYERSTWEPSVSRRWARALTWSALGIVWSGLLDIPAILAAFALPGGFWVC